MLKIEFEDKRSDPTWVVSKTFTIGSADDNNLVIDDPSVSPQHAKLIQQNGGFLLKDTGSSNGTFVNGKKVQQQLVACNDVMRFGDVNIKIIDPLTVDTPSGQEYWSLIASSSWLAGQEFPIISPEGKPVIIGRGKKCDITFPGTHLSRQHVQVEIHGDSLYLVDLDSVNGTFINDKRVTKGFAKPGDSVRLDVYNFKVFGPGFDLPRSATATDIPVANIDDDPKSTDSGAKQWDIPPTSPGNRIEPESKKHSNGVIALSIAMLIGLVGTVYYLWFM